MKRFSVVVLFFALWAALLFAARVYAYNTQEILNYCYPNSHYDGAKTSCDASSIQAGASCTEGVGGPVTESPECGCFGQNTSHTYLISHIPTQCNDGNGNITQFETFQCGQDQGVQFGQCGNPSTCQFVEDCETPPGDGPHSGYHVGTGLIQPNGTCAADSRVPTNFGACIPKVNAEVIPVDANAAFDPRALSQGQPINFYISATRACAQGPNSDNPQFDQGGGAFNTKSPDGKCTLVQPMTCDKTNPSGDWRKCWAEYSCTNADKVGQFTTTFTNNNPDCSSKVDYYINKPQDCANMTRQQGPNPGNLTVLGPSLSNSQQVAQQEANALLPNQVNQPIIQNAATKDQQDFPATNSGEIKDPGGETGLQEGFEGVLHSLRCSNVFLVSGILQSLHLGYCPEPVNIAKGNTYLIHGQSGALAQAQKPADLKLNPANQDCVLQDIAEQNGSGTQTTGNQKIDDIDTSFQTDYISNMPQGVVSQKTLPTDTDNTLSVSGKKLNDQRVPDVNTNCQLKEHSWVPAQILGTTTNSDGTTVTNVMKCPVN